LTNKALSAGWPKRLKRRFYGDRVITTALNDDYCISAWWLRTSSKFSGKKSKKQPENSEIADSSKI